ncbi:kinase A anchor protein [Mycena epipterygia]|nr:kinase A anchor protein [Mycena epipterygia]
MTRIRLTSATRSYTLSSGNMAPNARHADVSPSPGPGDKSTRRGLPTSKNHKPKPARPTHFLSLPLGHHPELRKRIHEFHQKLLPSGDAATVDNVVIDGLDHSILVDPRRLHFTIGVMALSANSPQSVDPETSRGRTLAEAIALLHSLAPEINEITHQPVLLSLDKMGVLKTKRQQAGVLYVGPRDENTEEAIKVSRIFDLVGQRFRREGFIEEAARPSVLHCTLINASHRKPRRVPRTFSYPEIFDRAVLDADSAEVQLAISNPTRTEPRDREINVDFGAWVVSEIQLCEMGSHGPENEYISCASVPVGSVD